MSKLCSVCGTENREEAQFCRACGTAFSAAKAAAATAADGSAANVCAECGFQNKPGIRYCANCGMSLARRRADTSGDAATPADEAYASGPPPISYPSFATVSPYPTAHDTDHSSLFDQQPTPDIPDPDAAIALRQQEGYESHGDTTAAFQNPPAPNRAPLILGIVLAVLVVAGIAAWLFMGSSNPAPPVAAPTPTTVTPPVATTPTPAPTTAPPIIVEQAPAANEPMMARAPSRHPRDGGAAPDRCRPRSARRRPPRRRCRSSAIRRSRVPKPKPSVWPPRSDARRRRRTRPSATPRPRPPPSSRNQRRAAQRAEQEAQAKRRAEEAHAHGRARGRAEPRPRRSRKRAACARSAPAAARLPRRSASRASAAWPSTPTSRSVASCAMPTSGVATCRTSATRRTHADARPAPGAALSSEEFPCRATSHPKRRPRACPGHAFSSLFQAVTGLRNRRALVAMLGCMFVGVIVGGLLVAMTGSLGMFAACWRPSSGSSRSAPASMRRACCRWTTRAAFRRAAPPMRSSTV
jgi:hypothetical protein